MDRSKLNFFKLLWECKYFILLCALIAGLLGGVRVVFFKTDKFSSDAMLYVSNKNRVAMGSANTLNQTDLSAAIEMTKTYVETLRMRSFIAAVSEKSGYPIDTVKKMFNVSVLGETELIKITVIGVSPEAAYNVAEVAVDLASSTLSSIFNGGEVTVVDNASFSIDPIDNKLTKNIFIGFFIGLALGIAAVFAVNFFDRCIHSGDDVVSRYNVSVLGEIRQ